MPKAKISQISKFNPTLNTKRTFLQIYLSLHFCRRITYLLTLRHTFSVLSLKIHILQDLPYILHDNNNNNNNAPIRTT